MGRRRQQQSSSTIVAFSMHNGSKRGAGRELSLAVKKSAREQLRGDLMQIAREAVDALDPAIRKMLLRDFLLLAMTSANTNAGHTDKEINKPAVKTPGKRRVTRSMARNSAIISSELSMRQLASSLQSSRKRRSRGSFAVPATPKINPLLPETPAAIKNKKSNDAEDNDSKGARSRMVRQLGSTISANVLDNQATMSLTMDDGKVVQVNLAEDPTRLSSILSVDALRDVKQRMESYAGQVRAFFRKLKFD
jgi:hypothetical protein